MICFPGRATSHINVVFDSEIQFDAVSVYWCDRFHGRAGARGRFQAVRTAALLMIFPAMLAEKLDKLKLALSGRLSTQWLRHEVFSIFGFKSEMRRVPAVLKNFCVVFFNHWWQLQKVSN